MLLVHLFSKIEYNMIEHFSQYDKVNYHKSRIGNRFLELTILFSKIIPKSKSGRQILHSRVYYLFALFFIIYCLFSSYNSLAQVGNISQTRSYVDPFVIVKNTQSLKAVNEDEHVLQIKTESLNNILASKPSQMRFRLPFNDTLYRIFDLKFSNILASDSKLVTGTKTGDKTLPLKFLSYCGTIEGDDASWVNISFSNAGIQAVITDKENTYEIMPAQIISDYPAMNHLLYKCKKAEPKRIYKCGNEIFNLSNLSFPNLSIKSLNRIEYQDTLTVKIAIESDYETYAFFGNDADKATSYLLSLFTMVSNIYEREVGIKFEISYLRVWTTPEDPYSTDKYFDALMTEFEDYWNKNMQSIDRNIAHFFTKRFPAGSGGSGAGLGMAFGDLCDRGTYSFVDEGFEGDFDITPSTIYLVAHELGHNFHSLHTHDCIWPAGEGNTLASIDSCSTNCTGIIQNSNVGTIMSYCVRADNMVFHPLTRRIIRITAENSPCIGQGNAESYTISGKVTAGGIPLEGATVKVILNGPVIASMVTDMNGQYSLKVPANEYDIECRMDNYTIQGPDGPNHAYVVAVTDVNGVNFNAIDVFPDVYEPDNSIGDARHIGNEGEIQYRTIHYDFDTDYITFEAQAGETYEFIGLPAENGYDQTLNLLSVELLDTDGMSRLLFSFPHPHFEWIASRTDTYFLKIQGPIGPYGISVTHKVVNHVAENTETSFCSIFPNPTTGLVNIKTDKLVSLKTEILVTSAEGKEIYQKQITGLLNFNLDLSKQVNGVYFLKIISGNQMQTGKIIILKE